VIVLAYQQERFPGSLSGISTASIARFGSMSDSTGLQDKNISLELIEHLNGKHIHFHIHI
jgi:hypothetical protein